MLELKRSLATRVREKRVHIEVPDDDTVLFRNVPTNQRFFNKARTNLLVKRAREGMPFLVCVDEDLTYCGPDAALVGAFSAGPRQQGWRVLFLDQGLGRDLERTVERALGALGFDGVEPALTASPPGGRSAPEGGLLAGLGTDLSRRAREGDDEPTVGREEEVDDVTSCLLRWGQTRLPLVVGESGVGKSNLLHGVARRLNQCRPEIALVCLDLAQMLAGTLFDAERENLLGALLKEAVSTPDAVLAVERLHLTALEIPHGALLLTRALDSGLRLVGTMSPKYLAAFRSPPLARRLHVAPLVEPAPSAAVAMVAAHRERIAAHHDVEIEESLLGTCVKAACSLVGCLPAKAMMLLDGAAGRAALSGTKALSPDDIYSAADRCQQSQGAEPEDPDGGR